MILVDSDVLIAHLRGMSVAHQWLLDARQRTGPLAVSVVSVAEILGGMRSGERREVNRLLGALQTLAVDDVVARLAGELRRRYPAPLPRSASPTTSSPLPPWSTAASWPRST